MEFDQQCCWFYPLFMCLFFVQIKIQNNFLSEFENKRKDNLIAFKTQQITRVFLVRCFQNQNYN
jgi:hypothetical protein